MKTLFLDSETTGLPPKGSEWRKDYLLFPYLLEMAWIKNGVEKSYLIYQDGREMPQEATQINGITTAMVNNKDIAKPFKDVLTEFMTDGLEVDKIIGYNTYFDSSVFKANVLREFGENSQEATVISVVLDKDRRVDLMRKAQKYMYGKWVKLEELYFRLFGSAIDGVHSSIGDCRALAACWDELIKRQIIEP